MTTGVTLLSNFHIEFFIAVTGISFMLGQLMFRRDPKVPDYKSFVKIHCGSVPLFQSIVRGALRLMGRDARFRLVYDTDQEQATQSQVTGSIASVDVQGYAGAYPNPERVGIARLRTQIRDKIRQTWFRATTIEIRKKAWDEFDGMARPPKGEHFLTPSIVEFPCNYLHNYLTERNFVELSKLVIGRSGRSGAQNILSMRLKLIWNSYFLKSAAAY